MTRLYIDASVLITLSDVDCIDLLAGVDGEAVVPAAVTDEIVDEPGASHLQRAVKDGWLRVQDPPPDEALDHAVTHLGRREVADVSGDVALLAHSIDADDPVVVTDDRPLRSACKALGVGVSGSIGVVVAAVERGELAPDRARETLYAMDEVGARLSASLVKRAGRLTDEAAEEPDD